MTTVEQLGISHTTMHLIDELAKTDPKFQFVSGQLAAYAEVITHLERTVGRHDYYGPALATQVVIGIQSMASRAIIAGVAK